MAGSPRKRQRREVHEAGEAQRAEIGARPAPVTFEEATDRLAAVRTARAQRGERPLGKTKEEIREAALEKFWPMAEDVVSRALKGEEVNREQLTAAFKVLEQQLGRPGQQSGDVDKDVPTAIIYESAAFDPSKWLKKPA